MIDTGGGIRQDAPPHIFDAFFTTKPVDSGTGLGLAICQRIITTHGGAIPVDSELGRSSMFRVELPPAAAGRSVEAAPLPPPAAPVRRARILVVDDEPMLGVTIQRMLGREHDVTALTSAKEAPRLLSGGEPFELILCNLMMPEMSGMDLYAGSSSVIPPTPANSCS
jgi:hypothetical protein